MGPVILWVLQLPEGRFANTLDTHTQTKYTTLGKKGRKDVFVCWGVQREGEEDKMFQHRNREQRNLRQLMVLREGQMCTSQNPAPHICMSVEKITNSPRG